MAASVPPNKLGRTQPERQAAHEAYLAQQAPAAGRDFAALFASCRPVAPAAAPDPEPEPPAVEFPALSPRLKYLQDQVQRTYRNNSRSEAGGLAWLAAGKAFEDQAKTEGWTKEQIWKYRPEEG